MASEPYLYQGLVLPERAQLSISFGMKFSHVISGIYAEARVSIVLNQVAVWVESEHDWNIYDLRNVVKNLVQNHLAMIGYLLGYAYDLEVTRVLSLSRGIDYVFGIDVPLITQRFEGKDVSNDLNDDLLKLRDKTTGKNGMLLSRCFNDLVSALKHADDTGFYCYRAIESLRYHWAAVRSENNNAKKEDKAAQWIALREVTGVDEATTRIIKQAADPLRHGELGADTVIGRDDLLKLTWKIVDAYISKV